MLSILLIGVVHQYQWRCPPRFSAYETLERTQRQSYSAWINQHLQRFKPQLIADEMALKEQDYKFEDTEIPWMYMDIPRNVREKYGLTTKVRVPGEEFIPEIDIPRENFWLCIVEQVAASCRIDKILILCGASHLQSFADKIRQRGHDISSYDLTKQEWYDGSWC